MNVDTADAMGYLAALLVFVTFWMKTMVPLRTLGIGSNVFFICYGFLAPAYPPLVLHLLLLPLNLIRLHEMLQLTRRVEQAAASGSLSMGWLKPFTSTRRAGAGEILFRKGDAADRLYVVVTGSYRLVESGIVLTQGNVVGEFALISPDKTRTQTLECAEAGELLQITYDHIKQLYFQNPTFGFYFLQLTTRRLFENIKRLEEEVIELRSRLGDSGQQSAASS
jgi:CRP/FNR family cyclic AMP-dependent transcriptional regulator